MQRRPTAPDPSSGSGNKLPTSKAKVANGMSTQGITSSRGIKR